MVNQVKSGLPKSSRTYFFQTHFMIRPNRHDPYPIVVANYKLLHQDTLQYSKLFFPININNTHWTSVFVDISKKEISYLDPFQRNGEKYVKMVHEFLKGLSKDGKHWNLNMCVQDAPMQANNYDCGIFTYLYGRHLSKNTNTEFDFSQDTINADLDLRIDLVQQLLGHE